MKVGREACEGQWVFPMGKQLICGSLFHLVSTFQLVDSQKRRRVVPVAPGMHTVQDSS